MPSQDTPAPIIRISQLPPSAPPSPHPSQPPTPEPGTPPLTTPPSRDERESRSKHVRLEFEQEKPSISTWRRWYQRVISHHWFSWVPGKASLWPNWKPVIRCALAAWIGLVIQLIRASEAVLGYAAFFVLVVAFMIPPSQPIVQSLEVFVNLFFFASLAWAWSCLGIFIAGAVRVPTDPATIAAAEEKWAYLQSNPTSYQMRIIYEGTYIQANPSIVGAVFLSVGTGIFLWYKLRTQPSPATFPLVLSCILIDVSLTTAAFYPDARYTTGLLFFLPMAVQAGLGMLAALLVFPESVGHSFQAKFSGVLGPLGSAMKATDALFVDAGSQSAASDPDSCFARLDEWTDKSKAIRQQLLASLAGVPPLRAQQRYLSVDISFSRLSGHDLRELFDLLATVQARSGGMAFFFDVIVNNAKHTHLDSSAFSVHVVSQSRPGSRPASIRGGEADDDDETPPTPDQDDNHDRLSITAKRLHLGLFHRRSGSPFGHRGSHVSLLDHLRKIQQPVGMYESQRYMDVERAFADDAPHTLEQLDLLAECSLPLVRACQTALTTADKWILTVKSDRHFYRHKDVPCGLDDATSGLQSALDDFHVRRLEVVKAYNHIFDPNYPAPDDERRKAHFRGLFQNFVAQYHLIEFGMAVLKLLRHMEELDRSRPSRRFWYPKPWTFLKHLHGSHQERHITDGEDDNDNDPAFNHEVDDVLGEVKKRNPEYAPFDSAALNVLSRFMTVFDILESRSLMYAVKAGILGALTTLPNFIASSAAFYYYNRGVWVTIMAQLTLAVFSGDTTSAWLGRLVASFWGCLLGMIVWYIGSGSGKGNPYGLGAACAVAFPLAMFFRIHFPGQVLTAVMTPVTLGLVIGYSYLNGTLGALTDAQWGWDVAWRRFVCVVIGITAAWIFSYLPPSYSAKRAIRHSYAQVIAASGSVFCDVLSNANDHHYHIKESFDTRQKLLTWRTKLNKLSVRHANAAYEFSLRGRWPEERYRALLDTLQDTLSLLTQLNHVLAQLDRPWRKALLDRTRLSDHAFLGDVLAVLSMCSTALRSGTSLPQITPSPLVARFREGKFKGLDLPNDPSDSGEIPSLVTVEVLESENYMRYALGITTTFSLLSRLDRIVVICKTLLGESYHISGLHFEQERV